MKKMAILSLFFIISYTIFAQDWKTYPYTPAGSLISFPMDEGRHSTEPTEWWYTSGHLTGVSTGNNYSYMLTYFYNPVFLFDGFRILNLSNDDIGLFFVETAAVNYNILATDSFNIEANIFQGGTETWHNKIDSFGNTLPFEYQISAVSANGALSLEYDALKPPLILADSGFFHQGASAYTYYYSQTKNAVTGTITFNGITENVNGTSWIDRQYGTFNPSGGDEYEWFCVQLSNGMDINIYNIFTSNNEIPDTPIYKILSAYVDDTTQYTTSDFEIERLKYHYMSDSLMCYSQKWRITSALNNIDIVVSTLHSDSEVQLPFRFYEGSTTITGTVNSNSVTGIGFAEMLHSYEKPDINMTDSLMWDLTIPLTWQLSNPDDGNPLKYDLEYSIDNQQTFLPIASQLTDTFYSWNTYPLSERDTCWIKITGYSIDTTLVSSDTTTIIGNSTKVNEFRNQNPVNVYPNPSFGQITIEGKNIQIIEVGDITGRIIYSSIHIETKHSIDLSVQPKGVYFVKVTTDMGTTIKKIILE